MTQYGVMTDYDYTNSHKRERISVWSGPFYSVWEATGYSLPNGNGYMLTTYNDKKVRVSCPAPRTEDNYRQVDAAIDSALKAHYKEN